MNIEFILKIRLQHIGWYLETKQALSPADFLSRQTQKGQGKKKKP